MKCLGRFICARKFFSLKDVDLMKMKKNLLKTWDDFRGGGMICASLEKHFFYPSRVY